MPGLDGIGLLTKMADSGTLFFDEVGDIPLVLQAGAMGEGGEIFVLDMGQPIKILDLANNLNT